MKFVSCRSIPFETLIVLHLDRLLTVNAALTEDVAPGVMAPGECGIGNYGIQPLGAPNYMRTNRQEMGVQRARTHYVEITWYRGFSAVHSYHYTPLDTWPAGSATGQTWCCNRPSTLRDQGRIRGKRHKF